MILDGKKLSKQILLNIKTNIRKHKLSPGLGVILIGKNPGSLVYVKLKQNVAKKIGINFKKFALRQNISQKKVLELINKLNKDKKVHGIVVQVPTPKQLHTPTLLKAVSTEKDVDGFQDKSKFIPPIHQGILKLLKQAKIFEKQHSHGRIRISRAKGERVLFACNKKALILGKNPFFVKGLESLLKKQGLKPKTIYIKDKLPLKEIKKSDVLITVLGKPHIIKPAMIKKNAIVIDVGYSRVNGKSCGDVSPLVKNKTLYVSPVPGGIGPLTVAYLLKNVYLSAKKRDKKKCRPRGSTYLHG